MKILLTGCAGFIGSHTLDRLLADGHTVVGVDNFDPFYARSLKEANLEGVGNQGPGVGGQESVGGSRFELVEADLAEPETYAKIKFIADGMPGQETEVRSQESECSQELSTKQKKPLSPDLCSLSSSNGTFDAIIHLAAKAGVRPSIEDPVGYQRANVIATQNLLEFAKEQGIKQFVFASSSSVYGVNPRVPWSESDAVLQPISPYASTKVSCELLGHVYSHLYGIRFLGLRLFTVYGPRQRPDLAINKFVRLIEAGEPIPVFGDGSTRRDYTFVDDIVDGIVAAVEKSVISGPPQLETGSERSDKTGCTADRNKLPARRLERASQRKAPSLGEGGETGQQACALPPYAVINLGNDQTVTLSEMIKTIEEVVEKKAEINRLPEQPGDVPQTWANVTKAKELFGYQPKTGFSEGIQRFVDWKNDQSTF